MSMIHFYLSDYCSFTVGQRLRVCEEWKCTIKIDAGVDATRCHQSFEKARFFENFPRRECIASVLSKSARFNSVRVLLHPPIRGQTPDACALEIS